MARSTSRRMFLFGSAALVGLGGLTFLLRKKLMNRLSLLTRLDSFAAAPPAPTYEPSKDRRTLYVAQGGTPDQNIDTVIGKLGGIDKVVGVDDVVLIKVSAQWSNQGMTNVAAVKRMIELIVARPGFVGEVIVFENTHFLLADGSGLSRAWTQASERNVDVPGWNKLGDLIPHFEKLDAPVSFVGLVDGGKSSQAGDHWHDHQHEHGVYGGDGRGPIKRDEDRDGYRWDFLNTFQFKRSWVDSAESPLSWPVFTSPRTGIVVDLRDGLFKREGVRRVAVKRKLTWITMCTANAHTAAGITGACKSAMGVVDMSAGWLGLHPLSRDYQSVHHFGYPQPHAKWRMAGPLAHFSKNIRSADLYIAVAEWVGAKPKGPVGESWNDYERDIRIEGVCAHRKQTIIAGGDPVAVDSWWVRHLLMPVAGAGFYMYDLDSDDAYALKYLRFYAEVFGSGTMDMNLIDVV